MKDLRHQHICQLYQVIETDEYYFLVLEVYLLYQLHNLFFIINILVVFL
jgi:hypothetical protein